jgi:hypothetical protein
MLAIEGVSWDNIYVCVSRLGFVEGVDPDSRGLVRHTGFVEGVDPDS